jgi:hypothetical protein
MWKDSDFKDLFAQYSPKPPENVWSNISYALEKNRKPLGAFPFFSQTQKMALIAASISSILLCGFTLNFGMDNPSESNTYAETPTIVEPKLIVQTPSESAILGQNTSSNVYNALPVKSSNKSRVKLILPEEYKPYEKEILALADLDKQIAKLGEEIAELKQNELIESNWEGPSLIAIESTIIEKTNQTWNRYQESLGKEKISLTKEEKNPEIISPELSFLDKLYIAPYMGTNYTNVFYQDKPANNFFSDKASFNGQFGYNAGVQVGYQLSKRWSLESGVGIGQYILGFKEDYGTYLRDGNMYIDQIDIPLLARYSIPFGSKNIPLALSLKGGLMFSNVIFYQVNYTDKFSLVQPIIGQKEQYYSYDVDKSQYNSTQFGYSAGFDFDAFFSKKIALNVSMLNSMVSQVNNFPFFSAERQRPVQFSTSFSIGTKIKF